ncbi:anthranilate phosphoribosyltransferase [Ilumatobacter nonamiensis]|uniref:anthranilate phosphoribosyltransferase n=1 Tax=Ilumatobacter nonamiensis TaxID=467093 RepID=UPI00034D7CDF|nr:anthranilate phosphoribosyltransferase [Ilumatobacter nonamiensis]
MSALTPFGGWPGVISTLISGHDLPSDATGAALSEILIGDATPAQIAGFLVALRAKGESSDELYGLLSAAMSEATIVPLTDEERAAAVDIVGTGGDGSNSINVSTIASVVIAAAGTPVCKHGNRSASSKTGAADVLEMLGVAVEQSPDGVAACMRQSGIGFCFAPAFHPAFRFAGAPRREMGVATAFNMVGPMANPGRVRNQLIGVADPAYALAMLGALEQQGVTRAWVVHGAGLDELTTTGVSNVWSLIDGRITEFLLDPTDLGLAPATADDLRGGEPAENAEAFQRVLAGDAGPHRDVVVLNAGAALAVAGGAEDLEAGIALAGEAIDDGRAERTLAEFVRVSQLHGSE